MKLSEKLAALEEQERGVIAGRQTPSADVAAHAAAAPQAVAAKSRQQVVVVGGVEAQGPRPRPRPRSPPRWPSWRPTPSTSRSSPRSTGSSSARTCKVSPLERRKFVQEVIQDTLGYGPLDPLLQDPTHHRDHVQRLRRDLGRARGPHRAHRPLLPRRRRSTAR